MYDLYFLYAHSPTHRLLPPLCIFFSHPHFPVTPPALLAPPVSPSSRLASHYPPHSTPLRFHSPRSSPRLTLFCLTLSALVLGSRRHLTFSGTTHPPLPTLLSLLTLFSPSVPTLLTHSSPHSCLALLSCLPLFTHSYDLPCAPCSSAPDACPSPSSCRYYSRPIRVRPAGPSSHPSVISPPLSSCPHGPDSGHSCEQFGDFIPPTTDAHVLTKPMHCPTCNFFLHAIPLPS